MPSTRGGPLRLVEDSLWLGLRAALAGECPVREALARMAEQVEEALA